MLAAHFLSQAIVQIGRVPGKKERRTELRHKLVFLQEDALDELSSFSHEMDLSEIAKDAQGRIAKGNLLDKLFVFASLSRSPDPAKLREEAIKSIQEHPLASLFGTSHMDREGKVIHRTGGGGMDSDAQEGAILDQIMRAEGIRRHVAAGGSIEAARFALNAQHYLTEDALGARDQQQLLISPRCKLTLKTSELTSIRKADHRPKSSARWCRFPTPCCRSCVIATASGLFFGATSQWRASRKPSA